MSTRSIQLFIWFQNLIFLLYLFCNGYLHFSLFLDSLLSTCEYINLFPPFLFHSSLFLLIWQYLYWTLLGLQKDFFFSNAPILKIRFFDNFHLPWDLTNSEALLMTECKSDAQIFQSGVPGNLNSWLSSTRLTVYPDFSIQSIPLPLDHWQFQTSPKVGVVISSRSAALKFYFSTFSTFVDEGI